MENELKLVEYILILLDDDDFTVRILDIALAHYLA